MDNLFDFVIPNWAVSPLINGDYSGLEGEEEIKVKEFVLDTITEFGNALFTLPPDEELDLGFKYTNDIDSLGADCTKLQLIKF